MRFAPSCTGQLVGFFCPCPDLAQTNLHRLFYATTRQDRKGGQLTVSIEQGELAAHFDCNRVTIVRDLALCQRLGYVERVGERIVRTEGSGYRLPIYHPTLPDRKRWRAHIEAQNKPAGEGCGGVTVYQGGRVYAVISPGETGGCIRSFGDP